MPTMDWLGSGDIRLRIGVTGDEGSPLGVRKMREMCKNGKNGENGQKWAKNNEKKEKILDISLEINATILHTPACTQKWWTEAMGWPIGMRKMRKMGKNGKNWENGQKIMKKKEKFLKILPAINATILHTPTYIQKWWTKTMGWPTGVHKCQKRQLTGPQCCLLEGGEWARSTFLWFFFMDVIPTAPRHNIDDS